MSRESELAAIDRQYPQRPGEFNPRRNEALMRLSARYGPIPEFGKEDYTPPPEGGTDEVNSLNGPIVVTLNMPGEQGLPDYVPSGEPEPQSDGERAEMLQTAMALAAGVADDDQAYRGILDSAKADTFGDASLMFQGKPKLLEDGGE